MTASLAVMTREQLLAMPDRALSSADAQLLLDQVRAWCAEHSIPENQFGRMACDFGGWVGLLRRRKTARTRMAALARQLIALNPDGLPPGERDRLRLEARNLLFQLRVPDPRRKVRPTNTAEIGSAGVVGHSRDIPVVTRDPCPRCGTRADVGCAHRRLFEDAA